MYKNDRPDNSGFSCCVLPRLKRVRAEDGAIRPYRLRNQRMHLRPRNSNAQDSPAARIRSWIIPPNHVGDTLLTVVPVIPKLDHSVELLALGLVDVHHLQAIRVIKPA